jgi:hypothetical protein
MSARFRIRTSTGQEISFASLEVFGEFVRSGDLAPDDVVYDAETKEWSSALTHPVVLQIQLDAEEAEAAPTPPPAEVAAEAVGTDAPPPDASQSLELGDIGLDLAPAPSQLSPDQEAAAFVAKMEAERAADLSVPEEAPVQGFTMEQDTLVNQIVVPPAPPAPRTGPHPALREVPPRVAEPRREPVRHREEAAPARPPARKERGPSPLRYAPLVILVGAVGAAAVYFGPELLSSGPRAAEPTEPASAVTPPPPPPVIAANEETVRQRARERFLTATQTALRGLDPIPDMWLRGQYLATPSDYPDVRSVWEEYLTTIREVRAADDARYLESYERTLDDARVEEPARSTRLASAMNDFQSGAAARARHYDRVEALAMAALRGHDTLVNAEGTIIYEPATGPAVSRDPVIEAAGRSPQSQALLEQVLDLILVELQGQGGAGEAANVREWVWGGLLDAVAN